MKALVAVLLLAVAGLGATSVYFYRQLQEERGHTQADAAQIQQLQTDHKRMEKRLQASQQPEVPASTSPQTAASAGDIAAPGETTGHDKTDAPLKKAIEGMAGNPAMRDLMRSGQRMAYGELFADLKLTPEQSEQFLEIIADQQSKALDGLRNASSDPKGMANSVANAKMEADAAMTSLLGPTKFKKYEEYQKTLPERMQITALNQQLGMINAPLKEDQRKRLYTAMLEEKAVVPRPGGENAYMDGFNPEQLQWQEEYDKRVRSRASSILTAAQLKQYDDLQTMQTSMRSLMGKFFTAPPKP